MKINPEKPQITHNKPDESKLSSEIEQISQLLRAIASSDPSKVRSRTYTQIHPGELPNDHKIKNIRNKSLG